MSNRYTLLASAKARSKTLDEYIAGGPVRWMHVQEEIAFDQAEMMLEAVAATPKPDAEPNPDRHPRGRARRQAP